MWSGACSAIWGWGEGGRLLAPSHLILPSPFCSGAGMEEWRVSDSPVDQPRSGAAPLLTTVSCHAAAVWRLCYSNCSCWCWGIGDNCHSSGRKDCQGSGLATALPVWGLSASGVVCHRVAMVLLIISLPRRVASCQVVHCYHWHSSSLPAIGGWWPAQSPVPGRGEGRLSVIGVTGKLAWESEEAASTQPLAGEHAFGATHLPLPFSILKCQHMNKLGWPCTDICPWLSFWIGNFLCLIVLSNSWILNPGLATLMMDIFFLLWVLSSSRQFLYSNETALMYLCVHMHLQCPTWS